MKFSAGLPPRTPSQRVFVLLLGVLAVLLPALVAGGQIDRPGSEVEYERLREGVAASQAPTSPATLAARVVYDTTAGDDVAARLQSNPGSALSRARLAMLFATLVIGGLLYLLVSACRGGLTAMFACLAFAGLPAVIDEGHVLRPEPLAAVFALLGSLLLAAFAFMVMLRRGRGTLRRAVLLTVLMLLVGAAFGVSAAALSSASVLLLVPAGVVTLAWAVQTWRWIRLVRRQRLDRRLLPALARRTWPWFGLAALGMASTSLVLFVLSQHGVVKTLPSTSAFGLLPPFGVHSVFVVLLMGLGATRLVLESGVHLSARRVHPSLVIVLFVALSLMHHFLSGVGVSALLPACAAAMLIGEGTTMALVMFAAALMLRAPRRQRAA